jgi:hypothetical protein
MGASAEANMIDELSRVSELAEQFESGTSTSRRYGVFIKRAVEALEDGRTDEGLAFELEVVESFLANSNRPEDAELAGQLSRLLSSEEVGKAGKSRPDLTAGIQGSR